MVSGANVRSEEEIACILVRPIGGDDILVFRVGFDMGDNSFKRAMVTNEFESGIGADFWDGVEIIAAEENTQINELYRQSDIIELEVVPKNVVVVNHSPAYGP